ncbi:MAG: hypothetical protein K1X72_13380 [Pyrinomonadaceae bacterium]|nr:hypothetical protein [Pyrinomonadaceae bacterium]
MQNYKSKLIQLTLWLAFATTLVSGQRIPNTGRIIQHETNTAFIESLVTNKISGVQINNSPGKNVAENSNEIVDFSFDGKTNCPLTIILFLNLSPNGASKYLECFKSQKSSNKTLNLLMRTTKLSA